MSGGGGGSEARAFDLPRPVEADRLAEGLAATLGIEPPNLRGPFGLPRNAPRRFDYFMPTRERAAADTQGRRHGTTLREAARLIAREPD